MKYAIYGINRVTKDFLYIFDMLDIVCFFEDVEMENPFGTEKVFLIDRAKNYKKLCDQILICDFQKEEKRKKLEALGLKYQKDFIYEKDLFQLWDCKIGLPEGADVVVWGTGQRARDFCEWNKKYHIQYFIDSYSKQNIYNECEVKLPSEVVDWQKTFIIIAVAVDLEITKYLEKKGLKKYENFVNSNELVRPPSKYLEETVFDKNCFDLDCSTMQNHLEILTEGAAFCCCTTFMKYGLGSVAQNTVKEIWNSPIHKIMCLSAANKTYTFCKKDMCPLFIGKDSKGGQIDLKSTYSAMLEAPENSVLGFDSTCNLKCETCRSKLHVATGEELKRNQKYVDIVKKELLPNLKFLVLAGDGEVFASQTYKDVYVSEEAKKLKAIRLLSNGMLFNKKNWEEFSKDKEAAIMLTASIDAATKETYESIRKNGNFDILKRNMKFASGLRKRGDLAYFRINFVVQKKNYREMVDFVKWGLELDADEVFFTKILNWGTYSPEEFKDISMMEEDGVTPKPELKEILNDPVMSNKIVDLGTIHYSHQADKSKKIKNYYVWELERKVEGLFDYV